MMDAPWGRLMQYPAYKAELVGNRVIEIDEQRTIKTCCVCKKLHDMKIWDRIMICDHGNEFGRDRNSAINVMVRSLSQNAKWIGYR